MDHILYFVMGYDPIYIARWFWRCYVSEKYVSSIFRIAWKWKLQVSQKLVTIHQASWRHIPEKSDLHNPSWENPKSHTNFLVLEKQFYYFPVLT
jgi:hypothetical protein